MLCRSSEVQKGLFDGLPRQAVTVPVGGRPFRLDLPIRYHGTRLLLAQFPIKMAETPALLGPGLRGLEIAPGTASVTVAALDHRSPEGLEPYREVAVMFPCLPQSAPVPDPLVVLHYPERVEGLGLWVEWLPVTTQQARDVGIGVWGFPKEVADIAFQEDVTRERCRWQQDGRMVLALEVEKASTQPQEREFWAYSQRDGHLLRSRFLTSGEYDQTRNGAWLTLGDHPISARLKAALLDAVALDCYYAPRLDAALFGAAQRIPLS